MDGLGSVAMILLCIGLPISIVYFLSKSSTEETHEKVREKQKQRFIHTKIQSFKSNSDKDTSLLLVPSDNLLVIISKLLVKEYNFSQIREWKYIDKQSGEVHIRVKDLENPEWIMYFSRNAYNVFDEFMRQQCEEKGFEGKSLGVVEMTQIPSKRRMIVGVISDVE